MKIQLAHSFKDIISLKNLYAAWEEFLRGKRSKPDIQEFGRNFMDNIVDLHESLVSKRYVHGGYQSFKICDPKPRHIHKASVRDRLLHHAIYRILYPFFERTFIADSFSCRLNKGTHKALDRFQRTAYQISQNHTRTCWILKCDIKKFFASIDQAVLLSTLSEYILDQDILWLLSQVVCSFSTESKPGIGLPLGNLTSQLFANVYLNKLDQFTKHRLLVPFYIRYADDFVIFFHDRVLLLKQLDTIQQFLSKHLRLNLHPNKIEIKTLASGVDFLGWVHFLDHRVLRTATKQRMMRRIQESPTIETAESYLGLLKHGAGFKLGQKILQKAWLDSGMDKT